MRHSLALFLLLVLSCVPLAAPPVVVARQVPLEATTKTVNVELILDASGSMAEAIGAETRMQIAKRVLRDVINAIPERPGINVGFRVYGHRGDNTEAGKPISCRASDLLVPIRGVDKAALLRTVDTFQPTGWTPLAYSLEQAARDFAPGGESVTNAVVLVTDGEETCDPPPQACEAAGALRAANISVTTHVVGFALTPEQTDQVRCIAERGGGILFGANDAASLSDALSAALEQIDVIPSSGVMPPMAAPLPLAAIRTLAYHQISALTAPLDEGYGGGGERAPILSDDGQLIAFGRSPGDPNIPASPNGVYVVNADGTGERQVDAYTPLCYCGSMIDISADGSTVLSSDAVQLRIADANAGGGRELVALDRNEINAIRVAADGSKVFFRIYRDTSLRGSSPTVPMPRGIYVVNADGSGLRPIVGPAEMGPLLGVAPDQAPFFGGSWGMDVSYDGSRILFASFTAEIDPSTAGAREGLFVANGDGSGLRRLLGPTFTYALNGAISGDGATIAYITGDFGTGYQEAGVLAFDGGGQRKLTDNTTSPPGIGASLPTGDRIQLNADGSRLLLGSSGLLFDTLEGSKLALGVSNPGETTLVGDGLYRATMNGGASRVVYLFRPFGEPYQLARLDLNPADLGGAPGVTDAAVIPDYVLTETRSSATVSARVGTADSVLSVGVRVLRNGMPDDHVSAAYYGPLVDDGTNHGDAAAGDGVFTTDKLSSDCCAELGPRIVRVKAEAQAGDGKRRATAVDLVPFAVVSEAPPAGQPASPVVPPPTIAPLPPTPTVMPTSSPLPSPGATIPSAPVSTPSAVAGCSCAELAAAEATIAAQSARIAELEAALGQVAAVLGQGTATPTPVP